ncbi:MAG: DUF2628 domain-containing protein [Holosporales bacterium]|nr:DUF2628 domain-containing protein [Holosporales bacterium]
MNKQSDISKTVRLNDYQKSILDFVCKKSGKTCKRDTYYLNKLNDIHEGNKVFSFNWAAASFSLFWFLYRKMYLYAAIFLLGPIFLFHVGFHNYIIEPIWGILSHGQGPICEEHFQQLDVLIYCVIYGYAGNICYYSFIGKKSKQPVRNNYSATHSPLFVGLFCVAIALCVRCVYQHWLA